MKAPPLTCCSILSLLFWRRVRWIFGVLLLLTALLKWRDFGSSTVLTDIGPSVEWALIQLELLVALWLFSGWKPRFSWVFCVALFASLSGAVSAMVVQNRVSCGCMGAVDLNPKWLLLSDIVALGVLIVVGFVESRFGNGVIDFSGLNRRLGARFLAFFPVLAAILGFSAIYWTVPIAAAYSRILPIALTGHVLVTEPVVLKVDPGKDGEWRSLRFDVLNRGSEPVRLIGAEQGCKCRAIQSLPVDVPAGGRVTIAVDVMLGSKSSFWLLTSSSRQRRLICRWVAGKLSMAQNSVAGL
jgi:hypothetical protein